MKPIVSALPFLGSVVALAFAIAAMAQGKTPPPTTYPELPSHIPAQFKPLTDRFDSTRRNVMIPMRDGVKLHTVLLIPKGTTKSPILLTRTPSSADKLTRHADSAHLGPVLNGYDNAVDVILEGGYIRVVQDVRGKHGSKDDYVVNRPLLGPQNKTPVDHATDTLIPSTSPTC
jgi:predicted acyl esterase